MGPAVVPNKRDYGAASMQKGEGGMGGMGNKKERGRYGRWNAASGP